MSRSRSPALPGRTAHDTAAVVVRMCNGARGLLLATKAATGAENAMSIEDLRLIAKRNVPGVFFDYMEAGSYSEQTRDANVAADAGTAISASRRLRVGSKATIAATGSWMTWMSITQ